MGRAQLVVAVPLAGLAVWGVVAALAAGGSPWGPAALCLACAAAVAAGAGTGERGRRAAPAVVAGLAGVLALAWLAAALARGRVPIQPLGYPNANGALFLQAAVASGAVAVVWSARAARAAAGVAAAGFAAISILSSRASALLVAAAAAAVVLGGRRWVARLAVIAALAAVCASVALTGMVAASLADGERTRLAGRAVQAFGARRVALWAEAWTLLRDDPATGIGPGRFSEASPTARSDADARWAHQDFLQVGAETGIPGFALLAAAFVGAFALLWSSEGEPRLVALVAAGVGALGVQASVDHLLHFPVIPMTAAAMVGAGSARPGGDFRPGPILRKAAKSAALVAGVRAGRKEGDVAILLYHRVGAGDREVDLRAEVFESQIAELASGELLLSLADALEEGRGGVVVTFDDGYRDFHEVVLPIVERHHVPILLYLATGLVSEGGPAEDDALTWSQLREAVATGLVTVGSHTHRHVDLASASASEAREEMRRSRGLIEDELQVACTDFSYPYGAGSPQAESAAREHFRTAALGWRTNRGPRLDPYRLGRIPVLRADGRLFFRAKVRGLLDKEAAVYRAFGRGPWRHM